MTGSYWEETQAAGLAQEGRTCWLLCAGGTVGAFG